MMMITNRDKETSSSSSRKWFYVFVCERRVGSALVCRRVALPPPPFPFLPPAFSSVSFFNYVMCSSFVRQRLILRCDVWFVVMMVVERLVGWCLV
jgi:hypothetical protein